MNATLLSAGRFAVQTHPSHATLRYYKHMLYKDWKSMRAKYCLGQRWWHVHADRGSEEGGGSSIHLRNNRQVNRTPFVLRYNIAKPWTFARCILSLKYKQVIHALRPRRHVLILWLYPRESCWKPELPFPRLHKPFHAANRLTCKQRIFSWCWSRWLCDTKCCNYQQNSSSFNHSLRHKSQMWTAWDQLKMTSDLGPASQL